MGGYSINEVLQSNQSEKDGSTIAEVDYTGKSSSKRLFIDCYYRTIPSFDYSSAGST